jgi:hypothetical protein
MQLTKAEVRTVLSKEQRVERTTCFSGYVVMYVNALVPLTGSTSVLIRIMLLKEE